mmetsp:Transcript_108326/g.345436  ORF Transcript_108326/g.345436 Transcript_108326/m.345436 type:complete len:92 (+) Transcript_108326:197-472(+)
MILGWFPEGVHVVQSRDPGTTGNFEITVNGDLVHSKKTRSQGFFEKAAPEQQEKVKDAIAKAVDALETKKKSTGDYGEGVVQKSGGGCSIM